MGRDSSDRARAPSARSWFFRPATASSVGAMPRRDQIASSWVFRRAGLERAREAGVGRDPSVERLPIEAPADGAIDDRGAPHGHALKVGHGVVAEGHRGAHLPVEAGHGREAGGDEALGRGSVAFLQHDDVEAARCEGARDGGAGRAAADDDDVGVEGLRTGQRATVEMDEARGVAGRRARRPRRERPGREPFAHARVLVIGEGRQDLEGREQLALRVERALGHGLDEADARARFEREEGPAKAQVGERRERGGRDHGPQAGRERGPRGVIDRGIEAGLVDRRERWQAVRLDGPQDRLEERLRPRALGGAERAHRRIAGTKIDAVISLEGEVRRRLDAAAGDDEVADAEQLVGVAGLERDQRILDEALGDGVRRQGVVDDEPAIEALGHRHAVRRHDPIVPLRDRDAAASLRPARRVDAVLMEADVPAEETLRLGVAPEGLLERLPRRELDHPRQAEARATVGVALEGGGIDGVTLDDVAAQLGVRGSAEIAGEGHRGPRAYRGGGRAVAATGRGNLAARVGLGVAEGAAVATGRGNLAARVGLGVAGGACRRQGGGTLRPGWAWASPKGRRWARAPWRRRLRGRRSRELSAARPMGPCATSARSGGEAEAPQRARSRGERGSAVSLHRSTADAENPARPSEGSCTA
jgi:hypothetical protein